MSAAVFRLQSRAIFTAQFIMQAEVQGPDESCPPHIHKGHVHNNDYVIVVLVKRER
jgi:hypothetical protein